MPLSTLWIIFSFTKLCLIIVAMAPLIRLVTLALVTVLTLQAVIAQSLPSGKYLIIPGTRSAPPPFPVGINAYGAVNPVIAGGETKSGLSRDWTTENTQS